MKTSITVSSPVALTPRVLQVTGMFDLPPASHSTLTWEVELPLEERPWHVGLIVGPSGCGKSTIARHLWPEETARGLHLDWPRDRSILDGFPAELPIKDLVALLSSVGFSSPPAWLRPFHVLSTGQQFRVTLARLLAEALAGREEAPAAVEKTDPGDGAVNHSGSSMRPRPRGPADIIVYDEFTSTVDRTVARIGSAALARTVRQRDQRFVAVTCHEDVLDWLQPDWVYRPAERLFTWRLLQRRPQIVLEIVRCKTSAWRLFASHHYLSSHLNRSAVCFLATWEGQPVAFSAWLPFVGPGRPARREHRTVTLPDYQGVGIGNVMSATIAGMWQALGYRATSTTTHPAMIHSRRRSPLWRMTRGPGLATGHERRRKLKHATTRMTAGFCYVGPSMPREEAILLLNY